MKASLLTLAIITFLVAASILAPVHASETNLQENQVLLYRYARISTSNQGQSTGDALYQIQTFTQDTLKFQITGTTVTDYVVNYQGGYPVSIERLEALVYLPPPSISQAREGNLDWISDIDVYYAEGIGSKTSQVLNYTAEAGTFQCVNITLAINTGWDTPTLSLLYDVDSGLLIYEQWVPSYGDIIVQYLASTEYVQGPQQTFLGIVASIVLPIAALSTPAWFAVQMGRRRLNKKKLIGNEMEAGSVVPFIKSGFPKKYFTIGAVGGLLIIISTFLPWGQTQQTGTYLPFSLSPLIDHSAWLLPLNATFVLTSLAVYVAAIIGWISLVLHMRMERKLTPQFATLVSGVLAFGAMISFLFSGWALSWGVWVLVAGAAITLISLGAANIHIAVELEPEELEETAAKADSEIQ